MAATHVKSIKSSSASSVPVTTAATSYTAGNLLVALVAISGGDDGTVTVTDTTNTRSFTKVFTKQVNGGANGDLGIFYLANATGGSTTVQAAGLTGGQGGTLIVEEWSGPLTASPQDVSISNNNASAASTSHDTGTSATTTQASELAIAADTRSGSTVVSLPTAMSNGYALIQDDTTNDYELDGVNFWYLVAGRKDLSSTGTQQTAFTWDNVLYAAGNSTFKLAAAGSDVPAPLHGSFQNTLVRM